MKTKHTCQYCGQEFYAYASSNRKYCSRECGYKYQSKEHNPEGYHKRPHLSELNRKLNPNRMTPEIKKKIRKARKKKTPKFYPKVHGRHEHRVVAEEKIGRSLKKGEVVHHIDGNRLNNNPENLMVFSSQAEHAAQHAADRKKGGDAL